MTTTWRLFGSRQFAMFDFWSFEHVLFGIVVMAILQCLARERLTLRVIVRLLIAILFGWEFSEHYLELGYFTQGVSDWKLGAEHWTNRFIADPFLGMIGGYVQYRFRDTWKWGWLPWATWGVVNYLAEDSMSVQELILVNGAGGVFVTLLITLALTVLGRRLIRHFEHSTE